MPNRRTSRNVRSTILLFAGLLSMGYSSLASSAPNSWRSYFQRPVVNLSASPQSVANGGAATLAWSTTGALRCTASGGWSGTKSTKGTASTGALTANRTFNLSCFSLVGIAQASATVTVSGGAATPTVNLAANPTSVASGSSSTLSWSSTNATSCTASGGWSGSRPTAGTASTGALTAASNTFTLSCTGAGGAASRSVTVATTTAPPPTPAPVVTLAASPASVVSGTGSTLTWSSTNATSCTASGAWSGARATTGNQSTGPLTSPSNTFTLSCNGAGGSTSQSVVVAVTPVTPPPTPTPTVTLSASPTSVASGASSSLTWSSTNATSCTASGAWSGSRATAGSASTGPLTAQSNTFSLSCSGAGGSASALAIVAVPGATGTQTGLNFPSNGDSPSSAFVAFQFLNPQDKGLPIWGPSGVGTTYIWKYRPRQQAGYYVTLWWSNNGSFLWEGGSPNSYYGAHPYPQGGGTGTTSHYWSLPTDRGGDFVATRSGSPKTVVKDQWYTQALRVTRNVNGSKTLVFYTALPSVANGDVIQVTVPASYGEINPPSPALTFGDSPWYASFQHERLSGVLRGIKIFNKVLSEFDVFAEAAADTIVTNEGQANVWYMNINPTPSDISDKSGRGNNPIWADPANRATLWTQ